jgi:hypothetical protein
VALPPSSNGSGRDMIERRRRFKQIKSFQDRLAFFAGDARESASGLPPGAAKDDLIRKARQADTAVHLDSWAHSPGLQLPR